MLKIVYVLACRILGLVVVLSAATGRPHRNRRIDQPRQQRRPADNRLRLRRLVDAKTTTAAGIGYAVNGKPAEQELTAWQTDPQPQSPGTARRHSALAASAPAVPRR